MMVKVLVDEIIEDVIIAQGNEEETMTVATATMDNLTQSLHEAYDFIFKILEKSDELNADYTSLIQTVRTR